MSKGITNRPVIDGQMFPIAGSFQQVTPAVVSPLTPPVGAKLAMIQVEGADLRWRDDGTNPTNVVGMLLEDGDTLFYTVNDYTKFKMIQAAATATVNISYYGAK